MSTIKAKNTVITEERMRTYTVSRTVSSRVGHTDFRSSAIVSWKNCMGPTLCMPPGEMTLEPGPLAEDLANPLSHLAMDFMAMATGTILP